MKISALNAVLLLAALCIGYAWLSGPGCEIQRTNHINQQMKFMSDRLKANPHDQKALDMILKAMHSSDSFERTAAIGSLGEAGSVAKPAVPDLIKALNGNDGFNARAAAISLGQIGPEAKDAIPDLIKAVEKLPNEDVGWFAAQSLGYIASSNNALVLKVLIDATNSTHEDMRFSASRGLEALQTGQKY